MARPRTGVSRCSHRVQAIELFIEYHGHFTARDVNGPPLFTPRTKIPRIRWRPVGLQVIEADLFP